jgi:hypothetical protein
MGVPGKVVRKLDDAERQKILDDGWKHYADNIAVYRESLIALTTEPPAK